MATTETKTADAILQRVTEITIGEEVYKVAPPTLATLISVSDELSKLPDEMLEPAREDSSAVITALRTARHAHGLSRAISLLILGAPAPLPSMLERVLRTFKGDPVEKLARKIEAKHGVSDLALAFLRLTERLEVHDFFALTTFLSAIRVAKPTKVEQTTTARGL